MENLIVGDLRIEALESGPAAPVQLLWKGKSNDRHPSRVPVELHFEKLDHFNSSTITALIQLIQDARERNVRLVIVFDKALKWQKLSFDALRVFSRGDDLLQLKSS